MGKLCNRPLQLRVMVVDDDEDHRWLVSDALLQAESTCLVQQASSAEEAIAILTGRDNFADVAQPDILFLDVEMPGMGGISLLERIKSDPDLRDITVVIVSGNGNAHKKQEALRRGADDFIEKSKDIYEMMQHMQDSVRRQIKLKNSQQRIAEGTRR